VVEDDGPGFAPENAERIFERYQVDMEDPPIRRRGHRRLAARELSLRWDDPRVERRERGARFVVAHGRPRVPARIS
jgi:hypothetical protein